MKLSRKTNSIFLLSAIIALIFGGLVLYFVLIWLIKEDTDEKLNNNAQRVIQEIINYKRIPQFDPLIVVKETDQSEVRKHFRDRLLFDSVENEKEWFRELSLTKKIRGKNFLITVRVSKIENEDFLSTVFLVLGAVFLLLLLLVYLVNKRLALSTWKPFYANLEKLKLFSLAESLKPELMKSDIDEFKQLNNVIENLVDKVIADFANLKQFTENASHEIQTPLAIIKSKIESILDSGSLNRDIEQPIQIVLNATNRLEKLNKGLLLLSKIENRQFNSAEKINFWQLTCENTIAFSEIAELKNISIKTELIEDFEFFIDKDLASIIISNLIGNALVRNKNGGKIEIKCEKNILLFSNSGDAVLINKDHIFERFVKEDHSFKNLGLGLAIVKKICDLNQLTISYSFSENEFMHIFSLQK